MKKFAILLLVLTSNIFFAQQNLFLKVKEQLQKEHPEIVLENKIIMINTWSVADSKSRDANIQLNKAVNTFEFAKLKGGKKGIIGVVINTDADKNLGVITLGKDKIIKPVSISGEGIDLGGSMNIVFDANGNELYKELAAADIFSSIQSLITR